MSYIKYSIYSSVVKIPLLTLLFFYNRIAKR